MMITNLKMTEKVYNTKEEELNEFQDLLGEVREANKRNFDNYNKLDVKLSFYFTLTTSILLLFINFLKIPNDCFIKVVYSITMLILILTLIILILSYNPQKYQTVDTDKLIKKYLNKGYADRLSLIKAITGTLSDNNSDVKEINSNKATNILICSWLIFSAIILIVILNILQGVV